jgi:predicted Zn-dependent peptidase
MSQLTTSARLRRFQLICIHKKVIVVHPIFEVIILSLNTDHQLALLLDLLTEQSNDLNGTSAEYAQITRLLEKLDNNDQAISNESLKNTIPAIYAYCLQSEKSNDISEFITSNQNQLNEWIQTIENCLHQTKRLGHKCFD